MVTVVDPITIEEETADWWVEEVEWDIEVVSEGIEEITEENKDNVNREQEDNITEEESE